MASFDHDARRGKARFFFRFRGVQFNRTVAVSDAREAERIRHRVEDAIRDADLGRLAVPEGIDLVAFFLSGGRVATPKGGERPPDVATVGALLAAYEAAPPPHLEPSTLRMQAIHARRVLEVVGASGRLDAFDAQGYASKRGRAKYRGRPIHRDTIAKELKTLRQAWAWVAARSPSVPPPPFALADVKLPKGKPPRPFLTWAEVEAEVSRGGDPSAWDCLWLETARVRDLLSHVGARGGPRCLPAMFRAAVYTGMRRSELCRSRVEDWRLDQGKMVARQKKRERHLEFTTREIPIHAELATTMAAWLASHPGGGMAFCLDDGSPLTWDAATYHFKAALAGSPWEVVRGWHVLRHSFASNLAAAGVDQRIIDRWMGHSTSIRLRYLHLRPDDQADAMGRI